MSTVYIMLADLTLMLHACFVLFVVGGQALVLVGWARRWAWIRNVLFRIVHLAAIAVVVALAWLDMPCPLTTLENELRVLGGGDPYPSGFVVHWLHRLLFYQAPHWVFVWTYSAFGLLVLLSLVLCPPRRR